MRDNKKLRIAYLSGPSHAVNVYSEWLERREQNYFGTSYMKQFFEVCTAVNANGYVITTLPGEYSISQRGPFIFENRPVPSHLSGVMYHLAMIKWFARLAPKLLQFKPNVLITTANQNHWFMLFYMRWFGVYIVPSFHTVLWPKFAPIRRSWRILWELNRISFLANAKGALAASKDISQQLRTLMGENKLEILEHLPTYPISQFISIQPPTAIPRQPFRVFFAGRIETNKGIYVIVEIARRLNVDRHGMFRFDICGEGEELDNLRRLVDNLDLKEVVRCHGFLDSQKLSAVLASSHAVIVPTTTEFEEGFNMVCAEAILSGRPVITSAVCPALAYVKEAAIEVQPDNVDQYHQAILKLADDAEFYKLKHEACAALQEQFFDPKNSWAEKLKTLLKNASLGRPA